jgi:UDP-3-O-[3-hydroxymyristoyl] glucosamine N-acyltransferase
MPGSGAADPRFFGRTGPHSLAAVASAAGGSIAHAPPEAATRMFGGVQPLQVAGPGDVSFLDNRRYIAALAQTRAGAVIVGPELAARVPAGAASVVTPEPYLGWARTAALFHPSPPAKPSVHPTALVDPTAVVDASAEIGPFVVIEARAEIGPRCRVGPGAVIGAGVRLGPDCRIGALASLSHALLGARVFVYPGARIGQEGFGFATTPQGFVSVPQLGRVLIEDDVEIGANTCVDRGSAQDTVIGAGSRLDNLVQIGHNVRIGRCCVIVAQVGISGSAVLEDFVQLAGQVGVAGHLTIGRGARLAGQAGVMSDIPAGEDMMGSPAQRKNEFLRQLAMLRRMARDGANWRRQSDRGRDAPDANKSDSD